MDERPLTTIEKERCTFNKLPSLREAFENMKINDVKKVSRLAQYKKLYSELQECAHKIQKVLMEINKEFAGVPVEYFEQVALDDSVCKRTEITLSCSPNTHLAYVGDSFLTQYISIKEYNKGSSPGTYQTARTGYSSNHSLANYFDVLFPEPTVIFVWLNEPAGKKKKATFLEALIGMLYMHGYESLAYVICKGILT